MNLKKTGHQRQILKKTLIAMLLKDKVQEGIYYSISSIAKISDFTYSAKTTSIVEYDNSTKQNHNFAFTIKLLNKNCVIDSFQEQIDLF